MFDIRITHIDAGPYQCMTLKKALAKKEKYKKEKYLQACLGSRHYFTPMLYSADRIPKAEALEAHRRLSALLRFKIKQGYSSFRGFVWARMSLEILMSKILILCGPW